jgi:hypothetical protein
LPEDHEPQDYGSRLFYGYSGLFRAHSGVFERDDICPGEDKTLYNTVFLKNCMTLVILWELKGLPLSLKPEKYPYTPKSWFC